MKSVTNQFYVGPIAGSHPPQIQPNVLQDNPLFPGGTGSWACRSPGASVASKIPTDGITRPFRFFGWSVSMLISVDGETSPAVAPSAYGTFGKLWAGIQNAALAPATASGQDPLTLPRDMSTMAMVWDGENDSTPAPGGVGGATATPFLTTFQLPVPLMVEDANDQFTFLILMTPSLSNCGVTIWRANYSVQYEEGDGSS